MITIFFPGNFYSLYSWKAFLFSKHLKFLPVHVCFVDCIKPSGSGYLDGTTLRVYVPYGFASLCKCCADSKLPCDNPVHVTGNFCTYALNICTGIYSPCVSHMGNYFSRLKQLAFTSSLWAERLNLLITHIKYM